MGIPITLRKYQAPKVLKQFGKVHLLPKTAKLHEQTGVWCCPDGRIFSARLGRIRKLNTRKDGYLQLSTSGSSFLAHRVIAQVFIHNPDVKGRPFINHKNGDKKDNRIENLEWCNQKENVRHARDVLGVTFGFTRDGVPVNQKFTQYHGRICARLYKDGYLIKDIAKILELSTQTVHNHLCKAKIPKNGDRTARSCEQRRAYSGKSRNKEQRDLFRPD